MGSQKKYQGFLLSIITPVYFEEECIQQFIDETTTELATLDVNYEIVFVDDGSKDRTAEIIKKNIKTNERIRLLEFAYNHGKESAVTAAINHAQGDYLLYMDPDLQDPPKEIYRFLDKILEGYDLVFGTRKEKKDSFLNTVFSKIFWFTLDKFTGLKIPHSLAVMRIFNRRFADQFNKYNEANRFIEGIFMHIGMRWTQIEIEQRARFAGQSKFTFKRKMKLAFKAIFDFSELPLKIATRFGMFLMLLSLISGSSLIFTKIFLMDFQIGWPSLFVLLIFGIGIQLFFLGLIGKYVGNIYLETKQRPLYSIKEYTNLRQIG